MVVSSACMITARMMHAVIAGRFRARGTAEAWSATFDSRAEPFRHEARQPTGMSGRDAELHAHADTQRRLAGDVVDADAERNALDDLDPVAAAVLRRQQREARSRRRADAVDRTGPFLAGIAIDFDRR